MRLGEASLSSSNFSSVTPCSRMNGDVHDDQQHHGHRQVWPHARMKEARQRARRCIDLATPTVICFHHATDQRVWMSQMLAPTVAPQIAQLLKNKAVAREAHPQRAQQQRTCQSTQFNSRGSAIGTGKVDAHLVQDHRRDHERGRPLVKAAKVPTVRGHFVGDVAQSIRRPSLGDGSIVDRQQDAGYDLHHKQIGRGPSQRRTTSASCDWEPARWSVRGTGPYRPATGHRTTVGPRSAPSPPQTRRPADERPRRARHGS